MSKKLQLKSVEEDRDYTLQRYLSQNHGSLDQEENESHEPVSWEGSLPILQRQLLGPSVKARRQCFHALKDSTLESDQISAVLAILTRTTSRYHDTVSLYGSLEVLGCLLKDDTALKRTSAYLLQETLSIRANPFAATTAQSTRFALLCWTCVVLKLIDESSVGEDQNHKGLVESLAALYASLYEKPNFALQHAATKQVDTLFPLSSAVAAIWLDCLTSSKSAYSSVLLSRVLGQCGPVAHLEASQASIVLQYFIQAFINVKTPPSAVTLQFMDPWIRYSLTSDDFVKQIMPAADKMLLRSPEHVLPSITALVQHLSDAQTIATLALDKLTGTVLVLSKSANVSVKQELVPFYAALLKRIGSTDAATSVKQICAPLAAGKTASIDQKTTLLRLLAIPETATSSTLSESILAAIVPLLAKESNEVVLQTLSSAISVHLTLVCSGSSSKQFAPALIKSMQDIRPVLRKPACLAVGEALWRAVFVNQQTIDPEFTKEMLPALATNLKNATTAPLANTAGPLEGYIAVALARSCLDQQLVHLYKPVQEALERILDVGTKPSFLIWDKVYTKARTEDEQKWLVRSLGALQGISEEGTQVDPSNIQYVLAALIYIAMYGSNRTVVELGLQTLASLTFHNGAAVPHIIRLLQSQANAIYDKSKSEESDRRSTLVPRLVAIIKRLTLPDHKEELDSSFDCLARFSVVCHHPVFGLKSTTFWVDLMILHKLDPTSVVNKSLPDLLQGIYRTLLTADISTSEQEASLTTISTLALIAPQAIAPLVLKQTSDLCDFQDLDRLSERELGILQTDPKVMFENVLAEVNKPQVNGIKNKDSAINKWDEEVRKANAARNAAAGKLSASDQALVAQQLAREADIRRGVQKLLQRFHVGLALLKALYDSRSTELPAFLGEAMLIAEMLLASTRRSLLLVDLTNVLISIASSVLQEAPDLRTIAVELLTTSDPSHLSQHEFTYEETLTRFLYRLRFVAESGPLSSASYLLIQSILKSTVSRRSNLKVTEGMQEQIALAVEIAGFHCKAAGDDLSYPRIGIIELLLIALSGFAHTTKAASSALILLGEAMEANASAQELATLLDGALTDEAHIRLACLQALQPADLTAHAFVPILWLLMHDADARNAELAEQLWLENGLEVDPTFSQSIIPYLDHQTVFARTSCGGCLATGVRRYPEQCAQVVHFLIGTYLDKNKEPEPEIDKYGLLIEASLSNQDDWKPRQAIANALNSIVPLMASEQTLSVFKLLTVDGALADRSYRVRSEMLKAAVALVQEHGASLQKEMQSSLQLALSGQIATDSSDAADNLKESCIILLGRLAQHIEQHSQVAEILERLLLSLSTPSETVQIAIAQCLAPLIHNNTELAQDAIPRLLKQSLTAAKYAERRGAAYGLAGAVKGQGVRTLRQYSILATVEDAVVDKKDANRRQGSIFVVETLVFTLGRLIEPHMQQILRILLAGLGDGVAEVREASVDASRIVMQRLSGHAVKIILPILLAALQERQWRAKKGAIDMMGSMAYLAPRQLSQFLTEIIPNLTEVLTDTHAQVRASGNASLKKFGEVVSNPEIQAIEPILLEALVEPSKKTLRALEALIKTTFVHFIDGPSLALVVPILDRGLKERSSDVKRKAAQIVGNMANLTEGRDFAPYLAQLTPLIRIVLIDPVPEARATAAKSLGSMVERLGEDAFPSLVSSLLDVLSSEATGVDQQGAAQGLAEILGGLGVDRLDDFFPDILRQSRSSKAFVREGYMSLIVFLPSVFGDRFAPYLARIIHPILKGLADDSDYVREASMRAGRMIVTNHSGRAVELLLPELENGLFDSSWRIRQSSMQLIGELLFKIVGLTAKADTIDEDDKEEEVERTTAENSRKVLLEVLGKERRDRILSAIYIVRQDPSGLVRQLSLHVWKALVQNTPRTLRELLPHLVRFITRTLSIGEKEQRETSSRTLGELCRKLGETILAELLPLIAESSQGDAKARQGSCLAYIEVLENSSEEQLAGHENSIVTAVRTHLTDQDDAVRASAAKAFDSVQHHLGANAIEQTIPTLLQALAGDDEAAAEAALGALREILRARAHAILPSIIPSLIKQPISDANAKALASLISVSGPALSNRVISILSALERTRERADGEHPAIDAAIVSLFAHTTYDAGVHSLVMHLVGQLKEHDLRMRTRACQLVVVFCESTKADHTDLDVDILRQLISLFDDRSAGVAEAAWAGLSALVNTIDKDDLEALAVPLKRSIEVIGSHGENVLGFCLPGGIKPVLPILTQGVLTGTVEQREAAAYGLTDVVKKTSPEAIKPFVAQIAGPLIRIIGERVPAPVRTAILTALIAILEQIPALIRPFYPQIQRTFSKNLPDVSSLAVRNKSATGLGILMLHQPRIDPLITELLTSLNAANDDDIRESYANGLAKVIASGGKNISPPVRTSISAFLRQQCEAAPSQESWCNCIGRIMASFMQHDLEAIKPLIHAHVLGSESSTLSSVTIRALVEDAPVALVQSDLLDLLIDRVLLYCNKSDATGISKPAKEARETLRTQEPYVDLSEVQDKL